MTLIRRLIFAAVLMTGLTPAIAQAPAPVPALPDTERRTSYSITATTCACNVNFALYGDSTDYQNWVEVWIDGVRYDYNDASHGWTITSPSGSLSSLARPITNAVLTFNAVQTGTVQIVGARRPRQATQFTEGGVTARALNQRLTDTTATLREVWDKTNDMTGRGFFAPPGQTGAIISGTFPGVIAGPSSVGASGNLAVWNGTSGAALADGGPPLGTSVETCGAKGDGSTDDAPAIRTCAANVAAAGGGRVQFSCNKTYLLGSFSALGTGNAILHPYSNVTYKGCGSSSVLKVKNGMNTGGLAYFVFFPPDSTVTYNYSSIAFRDFKIDNNGANNGGFNYSNVNIGCDFCAGVLIDNVTFSNSPGGQYIQIGNNNAINAAQVRIANNRFTDACDIINVSCTDHSSIFIVADTYSIVGNSFNFSSQSSKATAIEMHGISGTATGNGIELYAKSANIVAQVSHTGKSLVFSGNASTNVRYGVQCWAINSQSLTDIIISTNTFLRSVEPVASGVGFIDCGQSSVSMTNANSANIKIANNVISSSAAVGTAMTDPVIVVGQVQNLEVSNNIVNTSNGPCIGNNGNTVDATSSWIIKNNICIDTGATSTAASRRGILISTGTTFKSLIIGGNRIANVAATYMTTAIDLGATNVTSGYVETNNRIEGIATPITMSGTGFYPTTAFGIVYSAGQALPLTSTAALTNGQVVVGQTGSDPLPKAISGDATLAASGALTVTNSANVAITNDTTTNASMCILWATSAGGNFPIKNSCGNLVYNPSTGAFQNTGQLASTGAAAGYRLDDRGASAANQWLFYAQANAFRVNNTTDATDWLTITKVTGVADFLGPVTTTKAFTAKGTVPTGTTGSCVASTFVGGATAGKFSAAVCAAGTIILSALPTATNGYTCNAQDQTTPANTLKQTANTTTSVTFTSTTTAADVVVFSCMAW